MRSLCALLGSLLIGGPFLFGQAPVVSPRGAVNGVTFQAAPSDVAPGGFLSVFGPDLAAQREDATQIPLPATLGDPPVQVLINGVVAPLFIVLPDQINVQVPWEIEPGAAEVVVRRGGVDSQPMPIVVREAEPSMFTFNGAGFGPVIAVHPDYSFVDGANPPAPGGVVMLYATGFGPVDQPVTSGDAGPSNPLALPTRIQRATVGGMPASILFAGLHPSFVGLFQINLAVPELVEPGEVLQYFSGPRRANPTVLGRCLRAAGVVHASA